MCVGGGGWGVGVGGGGPVTSFTFRNSIQGWSNICNPGGGGRQTFFHGGGVQLLSDRTCDLFWTLDLRNYLEF